MQPVKKYALFFLLTLYSIVCSAQDSTLLNKPLRWNLSQCIDYAKKNNIQINTLRLSQKTAQQEYLLAKAARQPNLTGSVSQTFIHQNRRGNAAIINGNTVVSGGGSGINSSGQYS